MELVSEHFIDGEYGVFTNYFIDETSRYVLILERRRKKEILLICFSIDYVVYGCVYKQ